MKPWKVKVIEWLADGEGLMMNLHLKAPHFQPLTVRSGTYVNCVFEGRDNCQVELETRRD